ncbi:MAG: hypothetical protein K9N09_09150 [Candidatus Cloacimonetes bacterium]|nr:hypothetical protein [Candidatus Cloacimonadota bacterium]MCF7814197.1 hypothetical protein [Candidatus Cloacimonadota bacterium]MCF7868854.1 hypothetical protein [Candidatus Cloacimonadota bacterium]MCF7884253.1 hypothetical protein [Candidatus Cloacimonadota bacterium]
MIKTHMQLIQELDEYSSPKAKITRMIKNNEIIQLKRGIFLDKDDRNYSLFSLSSLIYGPSYVSFQSAMSHYGLIPERTPSVTCASFSKNKNKSIETSIGNFYYFYIPTKVYPYDTMIREENNQNYIIASPEKSLSDMLYKVRDIDNINQIEGLLLEDWRIEIEDLKNLNPVSLNFLLPLYERKICNLFLDWLKRNIYA